MWNLIQRLIISRLIWRKLWLLLSFSAFLQDLEEFSRMLKGLDLCSFSSTSSATWVLACMYKNAIPPKIWELWTLSESSLASALLATMDPCIERSIPPEIYFQIIEGFCDSCTPCRIFTHTVLSLLIFSRSLDLKENKSFLLSSTDGESGCPPDYLLLKKTLAECSKVFNNPAKILRWVLS